MPALEDHLVAPSLIWQPQVRALDLDSVDHVDSSKFASTRREDAVRTGEKPVTVVAAARAGEDLGEAAAEERSARR